MRLLLPQLTTATLRQPGQERFLVGPDRDGRDLLRWLDGWLTLLSASPSAQVKNAVVKVDLARDEQPSVFPLRLLLSGLRVPGQWRVLGELQHMSGRSKPLPGNARWRL
jgi:hypothetical protein